MKIEVTRKQYSSEIHMVIDTGQTVNPIEHDAIKDCLNELNLDETWKKKRMLREIATEVKQLIQKK